MSTIDNLNRSLQVKDGMIERLNARLEALHGVAYQYAQEKSSLEIELCEIKSLGFFGRVRFVLGL